MLLLWWGIHLREALGTGDLRVDHAIEQNVSETGAHRDRARLQLTFTILTSKTIGMIVAALEGDQLELLGGLIVRTNRLRATSTVADAHSIVIFGAVEEAKLFEIQLIDDLVALATTQTIDMKVEVADLDGRRCAD